VNRPPDPTLDRYSASRRTEEGAESYSTKYDDELHKRISSWFERRAVERALALTGLKQAKVLDLPCGAGRLTPILRPVARTLISADYSRTMVQVLRRRNPELPGLVADCFHLPFADRAFDLVYSARLSHHIGDEALRVAYLKEVLRVAGQWAIVTVFDSRSLKNLLRTLRRSMSKKRPKNTLSREQVEQVAAAQGFSVLGAIPLSRLASGHVFYVMKRAD
jgi:SAM-dependent methyltransferase